MRRAILLACFCVAAGCAGQNSQLSSCQAEKEQLLATIRTQRETTRSLGEQVASLESRLDQAEKELARAGGGTRISSRPAEAPRIAPTKAEPLPWRAPPAKGMPQSTQQIPDQRAGNARASLAELAKRERTVKYDAAAGTARFDVPVEFRDGGAALSAADKQRLDEVSRMLRSDEVRELPVVIAGASRERAQAVADYLDRHGIPGERLLVSGSVPSANRAGATQGVSIYLAGEDSPLVAEARGHAVKR